MIIVKLPGNVRSVQTVAVVHCRALDPETRSCEQDEMARDVQSAADVRDYDLSKRESGRPCPRTVTVRQLRALTDSTEDEGLRALAELAIDAVRAGLRKDPAVAECVRAIGEQRR